MCLFGNMFNATCDIRVPIVCMIICSDRKAKLEEKLMPRPFAECISCLEHCLARLK